MSTSQPPTLSQLSTSLLTLSLPPLTPTFLQTILPPTTNPQRPSPPLPALLATAKHRLLTLDLTLPPTPLSPLAPTLTPALLSAQIPSQTLPSPLFLQVLNISTTSLSKWEQVSLLTMERKGEFTKGRSIIRIPPQTNPDSQSSTQSLPLPTPTTQPSTSAPLSSIPGPFLLVLQDHAGTRINGFEYKKIEKIGYPPLLNIGAKILVKKGTKVARGMILLEPDKTIIFGGRIEALDKGWREGLEGRLRAEVEGGEEGER